MPEIPMPLTPCKFNSHFPLTLLSFMSIRGRKIQGITGIRISSCFLFFV
jgi:hypothetical protein